MGKFNWRESSKSRMIVVATDEEYQTAKKRFKNQHIVKTGVGGINVIKTLKKYPKWMKIINFGYAGSNIIPKGNEVIVGKCKLYHPNVEYVEPCLSIKKSSISDICCYTSNDFVTNTNIKEACVFDMELAYILALGFKNVTSIKIVSDNLSLKEYKETIK